MKKELKKKTVVIILGVLTLINLGLHLYRISYPAEPVFDEAHFSTYAADYVKNSAYFDIHPPLGKMIYGAALVASGDPSAGNAKFVSLFPSSTSSDKSGEVYSFTHGQYGKFPYVLLRVIAAIFGILLPLAFFAFLKSLKLGDIAALLGATFLVLDNALLLETKLILMNGMYLVLGLVALTLYLEGKRHIALAGIFFGLALSIKLIAITFAGVIIVDMILKKIDKQDVAAAAKTFFVSAFATLAVVYLFNFALFSPADSVNLSRKLLGAKQNIAIGQLAFVEKASFVTEAFFINIGAGVVSYASGEKTHSLQSPWYKWPVAKGSMVYHGIVGKTGNLVLVGNYALWIMGTLAAAATLFWLLFGLYKKYRKRPGGLGLEEVRVPILLVSGYFASLAPYFSVVHRSTFLYHYFPALLFSVGLLCWFLENKTKKPWVPALVFVAVLLSFILEIGCAYGASCFLIG